MAHHKAHTVCNLCKLQAPCWTNCAWSNRLHFHLTSKHASMALYITHEMQALPEGAKQQR